MGSSFAAPWLTGTIQGAVSPLPYTMVELGCDLGLIHGYRDEPEMRYVSLYPFGHINLYAPLKIRGPWDGCWYGGVGGGVMLAFYNVDGGPQNYTIPALDLTTGLYLGKGPHYFTAAYTLRSGFFMEINHKLSLGYSYRFGTKEENHEEASQESFVDSIRR
jgi:hypothetical protein